MTVHAPHRYLALDPRSSTGTEDTLFRCSLQRGRRLQFLAGLFGRSRRLLALDEIRRQGSISSQRGAGLLMVPISRIRGSDGRIGDFDRDFHPLKARLRQRWMDIAAARLQGKTLPPVDLVRIGDVYFVLDGHHRISVAAVLGQKRVQAKVVVWELGGALPKQDLIHAAGLVSLQHGPMESTT